METDYSGVTRDMIPSFWPLVEPLVQRALMHAQGEYEPEDIQELLIAGRMQLWLAMTKTELLGMAITEIVHFPRKTILYCTLIAGVELDAWLELSDLITYWAEGQEVDTLRGFGRRGWKRKLADRGFMESYTVYDKAITGSANPLERH